MMLRNIGPYIYLPDTMSGYGEYYALSSISEAVSQPRSKVSAYLPVSTSTGSATLVSIPNTT